MSLPPRDRKHRADGGRGRAERDAGAGQGDTFAIEIARALDAEYGGVASKVKVVARLTRSNEKTVKNWFAARNGPNGDGLVELMRHSDAVLATVLRLAGRDAVLRGVEVSRARLELLRAVALVEAVLDGREG